MKRRIKREHLILGAILLFVLVAAVPLVMGTRLSPDERAAEEDILLEVSGAGVKDISGAQRWTMRYLSCKDTDGGRNYDTAGRLTATLDIFGRKIVIRREDGCYNDRLIEWYCSGNRPARTYYECPNGCENGACKEEELVVLGPDDSTCTDTDDPNKEFYHPGYDAYGYNFNVKGIATGIFYTGEIVTKEEYCDPIKPERLIEWECLYQERIKDYMVVQTGGEVCEHGCKDGACIGSNTGEPICFDTDADKDHPDGLNYYVKGYAETNWSSNYKTKQIDLCRTEDWLIEGFCDGNEPKGRNYECPNGCYDGACIEEATCTDTDGGKDYYTQGTITTESEIATDFCWNYNPTHYGSCAGNESDCVLAEHFCDANNNLGKEKYDCPNGCYDGACIKNCTDTDGGDIYTKGTTAGYTIHGVFVVNTDFCSTQPVLINNYCLNDLAEQDHVICQNGCYDGACIKEPTCTDTDGSYSQTEQWLIRGNCEDGASYSDYCQNSAEMIEYSCEADSCVAVEFSIDCYGEFGDDYFCFYGKCYDYNEFSKSSSAYTSCKEDWGRDYGMDMSVVNDIGISCAQYGGHFCSARGTSTSRFNVRGDYCCWECVF